MASGISHAQTSGGECLAGSRGHASAQSPPGESEGHGSDDASVVRPRDTHTTSTCMYTIDVPRDMC